MSTEPIPIDPSVLQGWAASLIDVRAALIEYQVAEQRGQYVKRNAALARLLDQLEGTRQAIEHRLPR